MRNEAISDDQILCFLTGQISLEDCLGKKKWVINLLVKTYAGFETHTEHHNSSYFLSKSLTTSLSTIFNCGYFEFPKKTILKIEALLTIIEQKNSSGKLDLSDLNLSNLDLTGANFAEINCCGTKFKRANRTGASFAGANCNGTDLETAQLKKTNFREANCNTANFRNANLNQADFDNANLSKTNCSGANYTGLIYIMLI
ncbi:MAG: pentapeptide repeat protein [Solimicrobium sp.]|nr:pentapeptide repeat protein [Solimicrobium sp.]